MADKSPYIEWKQFAKMDFDAAKHLNNTMYPKPLEIICYHCQQADELYLEEHHVVSALADTQSIFDWFDGLNL